MRRTFCGDNDVELRDAIIYKGRNTPVPRMEGCALGSSRYYRFWYAGTERIGSQTVSLGRLATDFGAALFALGMGSTYRGLV
jgi:hypothetical protein